MRALVAACLALAALSLLLPFAPSTDPWAWIVWGREVVGFDLDTDGGPSWKPLPVLFTAPFSIFGDAAPELWLLVARAGGLLALVLAYRVASRIAGRGAGVAAAVALLFVGFWLGYITQGNSEPLVAAFLLWAIDRHLAGHHGQALALGTLAGLGRPEVWPFLGVYGLWVWMREPRMRPLVAGAFLALAALWLGLDWIGSGDPLHAGDVAKETAEESSIVRADRPSLEVLDRVSGVVLLPFLMAGAFAAVLAIRRREMFTTALGACALAWALLVAVMAEAGYPGRPSFVIPAAAIVCVLAGVGCAEAARAIARAVGRDVSSEKAPRSPVGRPGAVLGWAAVALVLVPFALPSVRALDEGYDKAEAKGQRQEEMREALRRAGGPERVARCGSPVVTRALYKNALAWELDRRLGGVGTLKGLRRRSVVFSAPESPVSPRRFERTEADVQPLASAGGWSVLAVRSYPPDAHVGGGRNGIPEKRPANPATPAIAEGPDGRVC